MKKADRCRPLQTRSLDQPFCPEKRFKQLQTPVREKHLNRIVIFIPTMIRINTAKEIPVAIMTASPAHMPRMAIGPIASINGPKKILPFTTQSPTPHLQRRHKTGHIHGAIQRSLARLLPILFYIGHGTGMVFARRTRAIPTSAVRLLIGRIQLLQSRFRHSLSWPAAGRGDRVSQRKLCECLTVARTKMFEPARPKGGFFLRAFFAYQQGLRVSLQVVAHDPQGA